MFRLVAVAAAIAVGTFAASATAADQIRVKGSDTGTFSLAAGGSPGIYLSTDVSSGVASHLGHYDFLAHETYDSNQNVVTPSAQSTPTLPPCASATDRTIANPRPDPPVETRVE